MMVRGLFVSVMMLMSFVSTAQPDRWQQRVSYKMDIDMRTDANQFSGSQELTYFNNSPDTLNKVFYHLYFNAFQPGSRMDVRSRMLPDPDKRIGDRILHLQKDEIGYHEIKSMKQDGKSLNYQIDGTVMKVTLNKPIMPNSSTVFEMTFESQVPLQIRRSGRDNKEGIRLSMAQWFPKVAEYDYSGWHAHEYIAREFYSPWGDYDVTINIDSDYVVAATGVLKSKNANNKKTTHRYVAENVHDFVWTADPDYVKRTVKVREGLDFNLYYQPDTLEQNWIELEKYVKKMVPFIEEKCGKYPYPVYNVIQGGDGGMEYPMATLITGHRPLKALVGVTLHEFIHSWYQGVLGNNESYSYWMDEGFNTYYDDMTTVYLFDDVVRPVGFMKGSYQIYKYVVERGWEEPMTTHADHFETNLAYGMSAYRKGGLTLLNLEYILGEEVFDRAMKRYYNTWKFKHPNAVDFEVIMEKESGLELSWFFDYWTKTTKTIDYAVSGVEGKGKKSEVRLEKIGLIPMPLDVVVTLSDGEQLNYHIPLGLTRGNRNLKNEILMDPWYWVNPNYSFEIDADTQEIVSVVIDPTLRMADINFDNNSYSPGSDEKLEIKGEPVKLENNY